jgi:DnaK suppressor protein
MAKATAKKPAAKKPVASKKPAAKPAATLVKKAPTAVAKPAAKAAAKPAAKMVAPSKAKAPAPKPAPKPKKDYKPAKVPQGYKPTLSEPYMNPVQLEYFRQKLLAWRKELMAESRETLDHLHEENWHQADIADRASLETEAGVELRTRNRYLKLISKIDAAIRRIEDGDYGYCEESGEPIGLKRLEARPVATLSIEAQERHEKSEKQYIDED